MQVFFVWLCRGMNSPRFIFPKQTALFEKGYWRATKMVPVVPRHALVSYISLPSIMIRLKKCIAPQIIILRWDTFFGTLFIILIPKLLFNDSQCTLLAAKLPELDWPWTMWIMLFKLWLKLLNTLTFQLQNNLIQRLRHYTNQMTEEKKNQGGSCGEKRSKVLRFWKFDRLWL